jgi:hypothetical protein
MCARVAALRRSPLKERVRWKRFWSASDGERAMAESDWRVEKDWASFRRCWTNCSALRIGGEAGWVNGSFTGKAWGGFSYAPENSVGNLQG